MAPSGRYRLMHIALGFGRRQPPHELTCALDNPLARGRVQFPRPLLPPTHAAPAPASAHFHTTPLPLRSASAQTIWNNLKYLAPPRVLAKTDLLDTSNPADKAKIEQWVSQRHLPTFMGGETDVWPPPEPTDSLQDCEARAAAAGGPSLTAAGTSEHKP
eukprot:scaffold13211_cov79-Isochrysis_galbana.AAC.1